MQLFRHKNFTKQYRKLPAKDQMLVDKAIRLFCENPLDEKLRNHALKGNYSGCNSIDVAFDLRIIFIQEQNYTVVLLLKIGTHSKLYR